MRELPILFSTPMVEAKLAGRKKQTRRIVKLDNFNKELLSIYDDAPEVLKAVFDTWNEADENEKLTGKTYGPEWLFVDTDDNNIVVNVGNCPYGSPGDLIWTREAWRSLAYNTNEHTMGISYKAHDPNGLRWVQMPKEYKIFAQATWKPSIHMHKASARIWDEVTEIRIERLAEISEEDAIAEGIEVLHPNNPIGSGPLYKNYLGNVIGFNSARESFKSLFLSINGKVTPVKDKSGAISHYEAIAWDEQDYIDRFEYCNDFWRGKPLMVTVNPWVWVISYKNLSTTGRPSTVAAALAH